MKLWTIQLAKWRMAKDRNIPLLDITVKSGDQTFAPYGWALAKIKKGEMSEDEYTELYRRKMNDSLKENWARWVEVCEMKEVAIACYCRSGCYCHRYLLKDYLGKLSGRLGISFEYAGELN